MKAENRVQLDRVKLVREQLPYDIQLRLREFRLEGESLENVLRRRLEMIPMDGTTNLQEFMMKARFAGMTTVTGRYLALLDFLAMQKPKQFAGAALAMSTGKRPYFGEDKGQIVRAGVLTAPRFVPGAGLWALTNLPTDRKKAILRILLESLGYNRLARKWVLRRLVDGLRRRKDRRPSQKKRREDHRGS